MDIDDSLDAIPSKSTGANRSITPLRLGGSRAITPQRAVNRAPIFISHERNSRYRSKRQQRRWENDNFFGTGKLDGSTTDSIHDTSEMMAHLSLEVNWHTSLSDIVSEEISDPVREAARNGAMPRETITYAVHRQFRGTKWEGAERNFIRLPKRLRNVVVNSLRNPSNRFFMAAIEKILQNYKFKGAATDKSQSPVELRSVLMCPIVLKETESGPQIIFVLNNSPLHRILLHAACEYHDLKSSINVNAAGIKEINVGIRKLTGHVESMQSFLLATRLKQSMDDRESHQ